MGKLRIGLAVSILVSLLASPAWAATYSSRDCSANSMIHCGFSDQSDLKSKLQKGDGVMSGSQLQADFRTAGMDPGSISSSTMTSGSVRRDGTVWVGSKKVATNAMSYGRQNIPGSTKVGNLWKRPTSVSLQSDSMPILVMVKDGQFVNGVMPWCGNVVTAKPVPVPKKPVVKKPAPVPAPTQTQSQTQSQVQTVNVVTPVQQPAPTSPAPLPQTGSTKPVEGLAAGSISLAIGALIRSRQRVRAVLANKIAL